MASHSPIEQHAQRPGVALTVGGENSALQVLDEAAPWNRSTLGDAAGITPSPAAVRQNHEPASTLRTADQLTLYQTV